MEKGLNSKQKKDSFLFLPCEFCNSKAAVLYCRADSAKLCLLCDQQIHSANALSLKHVRSQICDSCRAGPASIHSSNDNLFLCQDCDWVSQNSSLSVPSLHNRNPAEGFMEAVNFQDSVVSSVDFSALLSSGKSRQEVYKQLVEMGKRGMTQVRMAVYRIQVSCGIAIILIKELRYVIFSLEHQWIVQYLLHKKKGYDVKDPGFMVKNYVDFTEDGAFTSQKVLDDGHVASCCSTTCEDNLSRNSCSNQQLSSYKPPPENCSNTPPAGLSPESMPGEPNAHIQVMEQPPLTWFETPDEVRQKGDAGLFAQNRGNAMMRYREKKKNRRYDKRILYESRKARADTRKRVKGRFIKAIENH
ncbi:hypothetical protein OIU85_001877 [Salix viminalis]|uniref:CCT domain-containing protein n=1 Tax=Salix viminalis TaxID=40686 RepID=A0A9Q0ZYJ5_SALVM|nr:hypothetical protein OIU85_001877 [Salix viminalis]